MPGKPFTLAMDPIRMIDPPSHIRGSAFCIVNSVPRTLTLNALSKLSSVIKPIGTLKSPTPAKTISILPFFVLNVTGVQGDAGNLADLDRLYETGKTKKGNNDIVFAGVGDF